MALSARVKDYQGPKRAGAPPCSVGKLLAAMDGDELAAFREMLGTPEQRGWPASEIYDALLEEGYEVSYQQINKHRAGKCSCRPAA